MPWRRFLVYDVAAVSVWATYGGLIGYVGGSAFEDEAWKGLALALGLAFVLTLVVESSRRFLHRRHVCRA
jgi:membrane protein DedA with SNARE-associated domain